MSERSGHFLYPARAKTNVIILSPVYKICFIHGWNQKVSGVTTEIEICTKSMKNYVWFCTTKRKSFFFCEDYEEELCKVSSLITEVTDLKIFWIYRVLQFITKEMTKSIWKILYRKLWIEKPGF